MPKHPGSLPLRKVLKKFKAFGIVEMPGRGKGSEIILLKPNSPGSKQGPQYPLKKHGDNTPIYRPHIKAACRRFGIDEDDFWNA